MKKSMTRVLSLVLVLVMMLGVLPMASAAENAAGTFTLNESSKSLKVGGTHQISVTAFTTASGTNCLTAGAEIAKTYVSSAPSVATVSDSGLVTAVATGSATITVTWVASNGKTTAENGTETPWANSHRGTASVAITVTDELTVSAASTSLDIGYTTTLSAKLNGETVSEGVNYAVTTGDAVTVSDSTVTASKAGTATITASKGEGANAVTATVQITVNAPTATISASTLTVPTNSSKSLEITYSHLPKDKTASDVTVTWTPASGNEYIKVEAVSGNDEKATVKGLKKTSAAQTVTASFVIGGYSSVTMSNATCAVTVNDAVISCDSESAVVGNEVKLSPKLTVNGTTATDVKYTFNITDASNSSVARDKSYATVKRTSAGYVTVTIGVESYELSGTTYSGADVSGIKSIDTKVSFYDTSTLAVTLESGKTNFDFGDDEIFSKVVVNDTNKTGMVDYSLKEILEYVLGSSQKSYASAVYFDGSTSSSAVGSITNQYGNALTYTPYLTLSSAEFRQNGTRTGTATFTFTVKDSSSLVLHKASVKITIAGGEGDIHYETTYNKAITIDADDFEDFWDDLDLAANRKLSYVKFDVSSTVGKLYTDSTKKKQVNNTMKFYLDPDSDQYDLNDVYYVPLSSKTSEYIESINFTAVSNYDESYDGTMTIGLNTSGGDSITSRGVVFGTTYSKAIADTYNTNTGKTLGYVVFELPKANVGTLYSELSVSGKNYKVADSTHLKSTDKLWYSASSSKLDLADAAFVPAAGYTGDVTLSYTAYDANGNNSYSGVLRLKVTTKTASAIFSDVTAKSYSWAADSVDFLYYEGTAQGSYGKYTPASNITRRDFMLMLYRAFLENEYGTYSVTSNFPDVVKGTDDYSKEIYQAVGVAKYLGIAQGTNGKFNPTSYITRQEAMVLIYRTLETCGKELRTSSGVKATSFKDYSSVGTWATTAISSLVSHGVIQGTNDKLNPLSNITRAEMACILHRVITY